MVQDWGGNSLVSGKQRCSVLFVYYGCPPFCSPPVPHGCSISSHYTYNPAQGKGRGRRETAARSFPHHFYLHPIGQNLVTWLHIAAREVEKYSHALVQPCALAVVDTGKILLLILFYRQENLEDSD